MSKTITKTKSSGYRMSKAFLAKAKESQEELTSAYANLANAEQELQEAFKDRESLTALTRSGGFTNVEEYSAADARISHANDVLAGAQYRLQRAKARLVSSDTELSEHLAPALASMLPWYEVIATAEAPEVPESIAVPVLYLVQDREAERNRITGASKGSVTATLVRPIWGQPLLFGSDADARIESANVRATTSRSGTQSRDYGAVAVDTLKIDAYGAYADEPVITQTNGASVFGQTLLRGWCADLIRQSGSTPNLYTGRSTYGLSITGTGSITRESVSGDIRTTVVQVETEVTVNPDAPGDSGMRGPWARTQMHTYVAAGVAELQGSPVEGLGRVVSIEQINTDGDNWKHEVTFKSRVPLEQAAKA